jgi:ABC-type Fe3+-citrate transport system substrate-binding protein
MPRASPALKEIPSMLKTMLMIAAVERHDEVIK